MLSEHDKQRLREAQADAERRQSNNERRTAMPECCGEERTTPFCPECGKAVLRPLDELNALRVFLNSEVRRRTVPCPMSGWTSALIKDFVTTPEVLRWARAAAWAIEQLTQEHGDGTSN